MFYGFKESTGKCIWSIDTLPIAPAGVVMIESAESYDISKICLGPEVDGVFTIDAVIVSEDELRAIEVANRDALMVAAGNKISLLSDVVELDTSEEAEADLAAWRTYRVALYNMSFDDLADITWPAKP